MPTITTAPAKTAQKELQEKQTGIHSEREAKESHPRTWKGYEKFFFRIAFLFFIAISIPNNPEWYRHVLRIDWANLHYRDLYDIARFGSGINFFGNTLFGSPLLGYANWIITLLVAAGGALVWTLIERFRKNPASTYHKWYYWLRVVVRYRAGIGIIGFGFTKLLPVQMPYPSFGLLNTNFGDFTAQKIYWLSIGIVPWYQIFAGIVEVSAGALLLFRKTTTLGAALLFGALGDIVYVNFAYDGGVHVYSTYFVLLAGFLLLPDLPRIYRLLVKEKFTVPYPYFYPSFSKGWQRWGRHALKVLTILIFLPLFFYLQYINFKYDPYKQPSTAGVGLLRGDYAVKEFRRNGQLIPYDPADSTRWSEATFEKWTTLTFNVNRPTPIDLSNGGGDPMRDVNRTFELTGTAGGRRVFHYYADTVERVLYLQDKYKPIPDQRNRTAGAGGDRGSFVGEKPDAKAQKEQDPNWISASAWTHIGKEVNFIEPVARSTRRSREFAEKHSSEVRKRMILRYHTEDGSKLRLWGTDENKDSIDILMERVDRHHVLSKGKLEAGKY